MSLTEIVKVNLTKKRKFRKLRAKLIFGSKCANLEAFSRAEGEAAMIIRKATEDYLEAMLMMKEKHGFIRSIDVAGVLQVTKPSVSYATKRLKGSGYILMDEEGLITLTPEGSRIAEGVYERHKLLTEFFTSLGVDPEIAREDACRIEHDISEETFDAICRHAGRQRK